MEQQMQKCLAAQLLLKEYPSTVYLIKSYQKHIIDIKIKINKKKSIWIANKHLWHRLFLQRTQVPLTYWQKSELEHLTRILGTGESQFLSLQPKNYFGAVIFYSHDAPIALQPTYLLIPMLEGEI